MTIHMKLPGNNLRIIAEIEYKVGLSNLMINDFDKSVIAFRKAIDVLDAEIARLKAETDDASKAASAIGELEELKVEILNKIAEVEEAKQQSVDNVKIELAKLISVQPANSNNGASTGAAASSSAAGSSAGVSGGSSAGASSSTKAAAPKATDISHLVKRKKPDAQATAEEVAEEESPAKKASLE